MTKSNHIIQHLTYYDRYSNYFFIQTHANSLLKPIGFDCRGKPSYLMPNKNLNYSTLTPLTAETPLHTPETQIALGFHIDHSLQNSHQIRVSYEVELVSLPNLNYLVGKHKFYLRQNSLILKDFPKDYLERAAHFALQDKDTYYNNLVSGDVTNQSSYLSTNIMGVTRELLKQGYGLNGKLIIYNDNYE